MNRNQATFPSLKKEGWLRHKSNIAKLPIAADGVVRAAKALRPNNFAGLTTPSARTKVASRYFLDRASTPPFQGVSQLSCVQTKSKKELRQFYAY
jgi:hypothetical protein